MSLLHKKVYNPQNRVYIGVLMKYVFLAVFAVLFFGGCSYKHDSLYVGSKKTTEQAVANTKKIQILKDKKPIIFTTVTYLNSINNKTFVDKNLEQFVVGVHFVNSSIEQSKQAQVLKDINFKIDDNVKDVNVTKLNSNSPILLIIPASTPWSVYFLVETKKIKKNIIKFSFKIHPYAWESLNFEKDY